eukprot:TRINITY_DN28445_c0_g1_i1.p1 TRINITY_DN28445_c0_g1~~TRINITY_DN28445_c0_g1_i1.p1  ORF type:complete len:494 (-),score=88.10 TRINITY_DN28445_c0_g1_i1:59-1540(-)
MLTSYNPLVAGWIVPLVPSVILALEWCFIILGFAKCCGYKVKDSKHKNNDKEKQLKFCFMFKHSGKLVLTLEIFMAVTAALIASLGTFFRKFWLFQSEHQIEPTSIYYFPANLCFFLCRSNVAFYGVSKVIIYWQLYRRVRGILRTEMNHKEKRKFLKVVLGVGSFCFLAAIAYGVALNAPRISDNACVCSTPPESTISFVALDWMISMFLLRYFFAPMRRHITNVERESGAVQVELRSVVHRQLILSIAMLVIAPSCLIVFIYYNEMHSGSTLTLSIGGLPVVDLVIICVTQLLSSKKLWTRSERCLCYSFSVEELEPKEVPFLEDKDESSRRRRERIRARSRNGHHRNESNFSSRDYTASTSDRLESIATSRRKDDISMLRSQDVLLESRFGSRAHSLTLNESGSILKQKVEAAQNEVVQIEGGKDAQAGAQIKSDQNSSWQSFPGDKTLESKVTPNSESREKKFISSLPIERANPDLALSKADVIARRRT